MVSEEDIPFNKTYVSGREIDLVVSAMNRRALSGPGIHSKACEDLISQKTGAPWAALVPSCTAALEMSMRLLSLGPGDEVILPSYTFVSTATAVAQFGATPVFVDIDPVTLNIDPSAVDAAITKKTRAIFAIHYAGVLADMQALGTIVRDNNLVLIEDAAQAYGSSRNGQSAGTFGQSAGFSFHGTKNITAGEAGAFVLNDPDLIDRAAIFRDKGTDRARFLAGQVDKYTWRDIGSSMIVSELVAAFLQAQLEDADMINEARRVIWSKYHQALQPLIDKGVARLPSPPKDVVHNAHIFFLLLNSAEDRADLQHYLKTQGISAVTHYVPLHSSPAGQRLGRTGGPLPVTDNTADCLLRLPLWMELGPHQERVIGSVLDWAQNRTSKWA